MTGKGKENGDNMTGKGKGKEDGYVRMSDDKIKELAQDMYKGLIFTNMHLQNHEDIPRVFVPMMMLDKEQVEEIKRNPPGMIYEYMSSAGPLSINGMPIFMSFRMLNKEDTKRVIKKYNEIKGAIEKI